MILNLYNKYYFSCYVLRDFLNYFSYGVDSPKTSETIWICPGEVDYYLKNPVSRKLSGKVVGGDWDLNVEKLESLEKYILCKKRFVDGLSWKEAGIYRVFGSQIGHNNPDGCYSLKDLEFRYEKIDFLYNYLKNGGKFFTRKEILGKTFRESGGVYIHIDRYGDPIFGGGGCHRLAIAKILNISVIPAQIGIVHEMSIRKWKSHYRRENQIYDLTQ